MLLAVFRCVSDSNQHRCVIVLERQLEGNRGLRQAGFGQRNGRKRFAVDFQQGGDKPRHHFLVGGFLQRFCESPAFILAFGKSHADLARLIIDAFEVERAAGQEPVLAVGVGRFREVPVQGAVDLEDGRGVGTFREQHWFVVGARSAADQQGLCGAVRAGIDGNAGAGRVQVVLVQAGGFVDVFLADSELEFPGQAQHKFCIGAGLEGLQHLPLAFADLFDHDHTHFFNRIRAFGFGLLVLGLTDTGELNARDAFGARVKDIALPQVKQLPVELLVLRVRRQYHLATVNLRVPVDLHRPDLAKNDPVGAAIRGGEFDLQARIVQSIRREVSGGVLNEALPIEFGEIGGHLGPYFVLGRQFIRCAYPPVAIAVRDAHRWAAILHLDGDLPERICLKVKQQARLKFRLACALFMAQHQPVGSAQDREHGEQSYRGARIH